jgi:Family of unknown function (DUF6328)
VCSAPARHDEWSAGQRGETPLQRADRAYGEILQEIRVAQTGAQILFAFLPALAFQARFTCVTPLQRDVYATTLLLCAAARALLIAPAAFHRVVYRRQLKLHFVQAASRLALAGLVLLMFSLVSRSCWLWTWFSARCPRSRSRSERSAGSIRDGSSSRCAVASAMRPTARRRRRGGPTPAVRQHVDNGDELAPGSVLTSPAGLPLAAIPSGTSFRQRRQGVTLAVRAAAVPAARVALVVSAHRRFCPRPRIRPAPGRRA